MAQTKPSDTEIKSFLGELVEMRSGMSPLHQRMLDSVVAAALRREGLRRAGSGPDVQPFWKVDAGPGTPDTAIGVTDWATSVFGPNYWRG